ncbi:MAG: DUF2189 domain-containing protein [Phyllobacteriaceae bacterium]|nr:DUF2189 domain-containing protein [Phyllobacteriaceae bacterium]
MTVESAPTARPAPKGPKARRIERGDIAEALRLGIEDFRAAPSCGLVIGAAVGLIGLLMVASVAWFDASWMVYPLAIGFPLVGPFLAVGLYEVSRRRARGEVATWGVVWPAIWAQRGRELSWMAFVMLFMFWVWMYQIRLLVAIFLGSKSFTTLEKFTTIVTTTPEGWAFLIVGHIVGAALALALFSITVISIPLLLERDIDFVTALITSVQAVFLNPPVMLGWGLIVTALVIIGSLPLFAGLVFVIPILGHATWHLYTKAVEPLPAN